MRQIRSSCVLVVMMLAMFAFPAVMAQTPAAEIQDGTACPVTFQPGLLDDPPIGWGSAETAYGGGDLRVTLKRGGTLLATSKLVNEQGEIWDKFLFWAVGPSDTPFEVTGHRLDAVAPPLRAEINDGSSSLAVGLYFPTTGCWEVTGTRGDDTVTFVLLVARVYEFPQGLATAISNTGSIAGCYVTRPNGSTPPQRQPSTTWHGDSDLWTRLPVDGVLIPEPDEVSYDRQVVIDDWPWVGSSKPLSIDARLLSLADGAPAASDGNFHAVLPDADESGMIPARMMFSSEGCWEITGTTSTGTLTVRVLILLPES